LVTVLAHQNSIGAISLTSEQIESSAIEDEVAKFVAGRANTGGSFDVVVNVTDETITEWEALITAYKSMGSGEQMWFETISPYLTKAFFVVAQPPLSIPQPEVGQNGLLTVTIPLTIEDYKGMDAKVDLS
jgi:hypothetical protein